MKTALHNDYTPIVYIYSLKDPISNQIRYIGKTNNIIKRMHKHIHIAKKTTKSHKNAWINSLLNKQLKPTISVLKIIPEYNWEETEKFYIQKYSNNQLLNILPGGEGVPMGTIPWNKGTKGIMKRNRGSFKKRKRISIKTEIKKGQHLSIKTEFKKGQIPHNCKPILKFTLEGILVGEYSSASKAGKTVNSHYRYIIKSTKTNKPFKGFIWKIK